MADAAWAALTGLFACPCLAGVIPQRLGFLILGVLFGLALGVIPGIGGILGLAVVLPFTFGMDTQAALGLMIGMMSVAATSDTIPAVLFGIPGTVASQATILDGYPMSQQGQAGKAFGAAFTASMGGGLIGAVVLALSIPLLRPVVLAFASPEFFMLGILGITMVATISGDSPGKGLVAGGAGLLLGMIGMDPQTGVLRWTFGATYLWEGIPLVAAALGFFAIPELVDVVVKGTSISDPQSGRISRVGEGVRAALRHWFLVLRCSLLGTWLGIVPGVGGAVVDWFVYGHAMQTEKGAQGSFGKGDVRGVIAPESANNAKEAGALVPTIAFGVPGSAGMALLLAGLLIHGITPGPSMLNENLHHTYMMVWSVPIANIVGAGICLFLGRHLAKIALLKPHVLYPVVLSIVFLAAFHATRSLGDLLVLVGMGVLGWFMKRFAWPRPPLILGLVLSAIIEQNLFISISRHGMAWIGRPLVLVILAFAIATVAWSEIAKRRGRQEAQSGGDPQ